MPTITTDVDIDISDFDDYDLIQELEYRGYEVTEHDTSDNDLIEMVQARGYTVYGLNHKPNITRYYLEQLYSTYTTMPKEYFEKELKRFFREHLDVSEY